MKSNRQFAWNGLLALFAVLDMAPQALACAVCYGDPQSPLTQGAKQGIVTMLIVTYAVLIGFAAMFCAVVVRARRAGKTDSVCFNP